MAKCKSLSLRESDVILTRVIITLLSWNMQSNLQDMILMISLSTKTKYEANIKAWEQVCDFISGNWDIQLDVK